MSEYIVGGRKEDHEQIAKEDKKVVKNTKDFLRQTKVSALLSDNKKGIITVDSDEPLGNAFKLMVENNVLSLPVWDVKTQTYQKFIDRLDILTHIVSEVKEMELKKLGSSDFEQVLKNADVFTKHTVDKVASISGRNPYYAVDENAPLLVAMEVMAQHKMHRLPIVDSSGMLSTVVTQSHIVRILHENIHFFPLASQTIDDYELGYKEVIRVKETDLAINAFKLIQEKKISGVAIVNSNNDLIGNISATDIQWIGSEEKFLSRLFIPCKDYLAIVPENPDKIPGPHCVLPTTTIEELLAKFAFTKSHRIYVINNLRAPIGVISLVDLITLIVKTLH